MEELPVRRHALKGQIRTDVVTSLWIARLSQLHPAASSLEELKVFVSYWIKVCYSRARRGLGTPNRGKEDPGKAPTSRTEATLLGPTKTQLLIGRPLTFQV